MYLCFRAETIKSKGKAENTSEGKCFPPARFRTYFRVSPPEFICANLFCRGFRGTSTSGEPLSNIYMCVRIRIYIYLRHTRVQCDSTPVSRLPPRAHLFTEETWCRVYKGGRILARISTATVKSPCAAPGVRGTP